VTGTLFTSLVVKVLVLIIALAFLSRESTKRVKFATPFLSILVAVVLLLLIQPYLIR
jgi:hypothetical protein